MEVFEPIAWLAMGFAPTIAAMEVAWRLGRRGKLAPVELGVRQ